MVEISSHSTLLDDASRELILIALDNCRATSPCGMVFDHAISLGATTDKALLAASVSELFYGVCSYTDDLQDGEADDYMNDVSFALRLNTQAHLFCLVAVRARELAVNMAEMTGLEMVVGIYRTGAAMLNGQRMEIVRDTWNVETYEVVGRRIAGDQYGAQLSLAACAAGVDPGNWARFGHAFGTLLQLVVDKETGDERLLVLENSDIEVLKKRLTAELKEVIFPLGAAAEKFTEALLKRCSNAFSNGHG
jgi:hypothetical protein